MGSPDAFYESASQRLAGSIQEFQDRGRYVLNLHEATAQLIGDVRGHIARPTLCNVKSHDTSGTFIMAFHQMSHQRCMIGVLFGCFAPGAPEAAVKVLKHKVGKPQSR
ncbi:hypothetical protein [Bradyrhizobium monzae]|uniref:hypothetical protein n=1 Tax=Bradyrhizobium sp. Oc8 TaxID=2876780 RepID=UPI001F249A90|nr:hypothetical protein [Bradyrhizobium sp. Oc8]